MTKQEFKTTDLALVFICSINPETGKTLYDTYSACTADSWMKDFKRDFPDMIHLFIFNKAAMEERKERLFSK